MKLFYRLVAAGLTLWAAKIIATQIRRNRDLHEAVEERFDGVLADSFPSSDPPSAWAGNS